MFSNIFKHGGRLGPRAGWLAAIALVGFTASAQAQDVVTKDAFLVGQTIAWSLQGPVAAAEAVPVVYARGAAPKPLVRGSTLDFQTHNLTIASYHSLEGRPNTRIVNGVVELRDTADRGVAARFLAQYDLAANGSYRVAKTEVKTVTVPSPRVAAFFVPAGKARGATGKSPFAMIDFARAAAVPVTTQDKQPRDYVLFVFSLDRLPAGDKFGVQTLDGTTGQVLARGKRSESNGWYMASLRLKTALNGAAGHYFPISYTPAPTAAAVKGPRAAPVPLPLVARYKAKVYPSWSAK